MTALEYFETGKLELQLPLPFLAVVPGVGAVAGAGAGLLTKSIAESNANVFKIKLIQAQARQDLATYSRLENSVKAKTGKYSLNLKEILESSGNQNKITTNYILGFSTSCKKYLNAKDSVVLNSIDNQLPHQNTQAPELGPMKAMIKWTLDYDPRFQCRDPKTGFTLLALGAQPNGDIWSINEKGEVSAFDFSRK